MVCDLAGFWMPISVHLRRLESPLSRLETVYLGQVTFLLPSEIALLACAPELTSLRSVRLVDTYQGSIWGPRVRILDVEKAATDIYLEALGNDSFLANTRDTLASRVQRVRSLVRCEGKTERIVGGDRMDVH